MSIEDHRPWVEKNLGRLPPAPVEKRTIERAIAQVAAALGQTEQQLVDSVITDCAYWLEKAEAEELGR